MSNKSSSSRATSFKPAPAATTIPVTTQHSSHMGNQPTLPPPPPKQELQILNESAIRYNHFLLDYTHTSVSALAGCTAGLLGLTALYGFAFYFTCSLLMIAAIYVALGDRFDKYFLSKRHMFSAVPIFSGIQTYLLFWTFMYGMVHVY